MAKDPAALFFIDKWLLATAEMKADCKAWYLELILHQFDKKSLPNDLEELAHLARVRVSEFEHFKQVFENVLKHKFKQKPDGRLVNDFAEEVIQNREQFKEKRSNAGKMSYFAKFMRKFCKDENVIRFVLQNTDFDNLDTKNEILLEQVFKQTSKLYINVNTNVIVSEYIDTNKDSIVYTDSIDENFEEKKSELIDILCDKYGYTQNRHHRQKSVIMAYINTLIKSQDDYDYFLDNSKSYADYKTLSKERWHGFEGLFGTQSERFEDGALQKVNWQKRLENHQLYEQPKTKFERTAQAFNEAFNPYE